MKRILQIVNYYYPNFGGEEQVARDIANVLKGSLEYQQKIICFNETAQDGDYNCKREETIHDIIDGVEVIRCGCFTKVSSQSLSTTFGRELDRIMNEFNPNIVIFHYPNPFQTAFLLRYKKMKFKLLVYWHLDITKQRILKHLFRQQNLALIKRMDYVLGATPMHVETSEFTPYFGNKKKILPYMIDEKSLVLSAKEEKRAEEIKAKYKGQVIGFFIGRHIPYKGLKYLIEASKELDVVPLKLLIAGSGELTEELKAQAAGDTKIEFLGRISDAERRAYYKACDIICFPSITRNEAFGLALAEGMYFGKPAITFYIYGSGVNYVNLDNITGIECPNRDSHAYADAILKLVNDSELRARMGEAAKERVKNNFTEEIFKKNVLELLASL